MTDTPTDPVTIGDITVTDADRYVVWATLGGMTDDMPEAQKAAIRERLHDGAVAEAMALGLV